jgi:hypothetical protein
VCPEQLIIAPQKLRVNDRGTLGTFLLKPFDLSVYVRDLLIYLCDLLVYFALPSRELFFCRSDARGFGFDLVHQGDGFIFQAIHARAGVFHSESKGFHLLVAEQACAQLFLVLMDLGIKVIHFAAAFTAAALQLFELFSFGTNLGSLAFNRLSKCLATPLQASDFDGPLAQGYLLLVHVEKLF